MNRTLASTSSSDRNAVPFNQAEADKFFGRLTIIASVVGIAASLAATVLVILGR
jgi:hypothetical protein